MGQSGETDFEALRELIRDALPHLNDPEYQGNEALYRAVGCDPGLGCAALQSLLIEAIAAMEPEADVAGDCLPRRAYSALHLHFVLGLTQEETAERLFMSRRNLQRVQIEATHLLARRLYARVHAPTSEQAEQSGYAEDQGAQDGLDWQAQATAELARLRDGAPGATADIDEVVEGVLELVAVLAARHGVQVDRGFVQAGLEAAIHPSALRQMLISAAGRLLPHVADRASIHATLQDGRVQLTITGPRRDDVARPTTETLRDIIRPAGTSLHLEESGNHLYLSVGVSPTEQSKVLVIEDNPDMVDFYRRCTAGTTYRIVPWRGGPGIEHALDAVAPDIVVLDVMLPEIDGWELLSRLHENASTRGIPVVVCSVVREEELALALGAAAFLSKPVRPRDFVATLAQVGRPAPAEGVTEPTRLSAAD